LKLRFILNRGQVLNCICPFILSAHREQKGLKMENEGTETATGELNGQESHESERGQEVTPEAKILEIAAAVGWKEGGPLDAETFLKTMPGRFKEQSSELKSIKKMVEHNNKLVTQTINQKVQEQLAVADEQRNAAILRGDVAAVKTIDKQIQTLESSQTKEHVDDGIKPEVQEFIARNSAWFDKDAKMTRRAIAYKDEFFSDNPNGSLTAAMEYAENELKKAFPDKFSDKTYTPPPTGVEGGTNIGTKSEPWQQVKTKMSTFEKSAMDDMISQIKAVNPKYTEKEYIEAFISEGRK
jgi:hypothetical protein